MNWNIQANPLDSNRNQRPEIHTFLLEMSGNGSLFFLQLGLGVLCMGMKSCLCTDEGEMCAG